MIDLTEILNWIAANEVEVIASVFGLIFIFLQYKASAWMWVFSFFMSSMYVYVNFVNQLYANFALQVLYSFMAIAGLLEWMGIRHQRKAPPITSMPRMYIKKTIFITVSLALFFIVVLAILGETQQPLFDGLTTALGITGTWMTIRKYYQEWICWVIVDPLMCVMYALAGMWAAAILYGIYSLVVVFGYYRWKRLSQPTDKEAI